MTLRSFKLTIVQRHGEEKHSVCNVPLKQFQRGLCQTALSIVYTLVVNTPALYCPLLRPLHVKPPPTPPHPPRRRIITNKSPPSERQINTEGDSTHADARTEHHARLHRKRNVRPSSLRLNACLCGDHRSEQLLKAKRDGGSRLPPTAARLQLRTRHRQKKRGGGFS